MDNLVSFKMRHFWWFSNSVDWVQFGGAYFSIDFYNSKLFLFPLKKREFFTLIELCRSFQAFDKSNFCGDSCLEAAFANHLTTLPTWWQQSWGCYSALLATQTATTNSKKATQHTEMHQKVFVFSFGPMHPLRLRIDLFLVPLWLLLFLRRTTIHIFPRLIQC